MTRLLIREAARASAASVGLAFILVWFVFGLSDAIGVLLGGALSAGSFLGLIYLVGDMLDANQKAKQKGWSLLLLVGKLALGGLIVWLALTRWQVSGLGLLVGIGASIAGFTVGTTRATSSKEGQAAMKAEEERIARDEEKRGS